MFDFQVHWKGKLITRISGVSISSPMGTGVMLEILGFLGNHVLPKFIFKNNPNKHQSHMEELSCFAFFVFFALFAFFCFFMCSSWDSNPGPRTCESPSYPPTWFYWRWKKSNANWKSMEKIKCELEKHEHQLSCLLPSVRSPQLGGMWVLIFLEYMNSDVFVLSNKTLGTFFNQNYCKLYQTNIETSLDSTWIKVQHKSNKQQQKYYLMLISKFYQVHIRQLVP